MYRVITVPGIGEAVSKDGKPVGMLKIFTDALPTDRFVAEQFNWRNTYGPIPYTNGEAYAKNLAAGTTDLQTRIKNAAEKVILAGYSGGAHLASLAAVGADNLAGIVMVANPARRVGDSDAPFYGVTGFQHADFPDVPFFDEANPADVIPCCPPNQPLRDLSDLTANFSLSEPIPWGQALYGALLSGAGQKAFQHASLQDWWAAIGYTRGYLFDGQHTTYYQTKMQTLASDVAARIS